MARIVKTLGRNRDLPQLPTITAASAQAGTSYDTEHVIAGIPDLTQSASTGSSGDIAQNSMVARYAMLTFETAITGAATNNAAFNIVQRRSGAVLVNTTSSTTIIAGTGVVVTPASMTNIANGQRLTFSGGTGTSETVTVYNVSATTFTTDFTNGHSGAYTIVSAPLASITFASGTNATAYQPIQLAIPRNSHVLKAGDVITVQRLSAGTGLATPAFTTSIDWVPAGVN